VRRDPAEASKVRGLHRDQSEDAWVSDEVGILLAGGDHSAVDLLSSESEAKLLGQGEAADSRQIVRHSEMNA
jgi:hypothetical protein